MDWQAHRREAHRLNRTQEFLKQIVYGGNDGIVTTFAIVAGFAGAQADGVAQIGGVAVLVFGLANLFADAVSMGLGEYLSARSQHDLYRSRRLSELQEIQENPDQERMELFEILRQRGLPAGGADAVVELLERALRAGDGEDVMRRGEGLGERGAEPPRGARHEGEGSVVGHGPLFPRRGAAGKPGEGALPPLGLRPIHPRGISGKRKGRGLARRRRCRPEARARQKGVFFRGRIVDFARDPRFRGDCTVTLAQAALGQRSLTTQALLVLTGSAALGLLSQVEVPMLPVPMSLQTLGVTLIGLTLGARLAALTVLAYLAQGAAGLPVFSGGDAGAHHLVGPTAGFLWGFVAMAWATGWLVERGLDRGLLRLFAAAAVPAALLYVPGVAWLTLFVGLDLSTAIAAGAAPFLLGDAIKCAIAAVTVSGGWKALGARRR